MERNFFINLVKRIGNHEIFALTAQMAYGLVVAFFPLLMSLMALIGKLDLDPQGVLLTLKALLPITVYDLIKSTVAGVVTYENSNLLSISIVVTIWTASAGFRAVIRGLNRAYNQKETRNFIRVVLTAVFCTFAFVAIIIFTLVLIVFGNLIGNYLIKYMVYKDLVRNIWNLLRYSFIVLIMLGVFMLIYRYTPCIRLKWTEVFPGAVVATVCWIMASLIFSFYVNNFSTSTTVYGVIGAFLILMTWLYLTSFLVLLGGEINAYLLEYKEDKAKRAEN